MSKTKVFCIGYQKTGTSSLRDALRSLGYSVAGVYGRDMKLAEVKQRYVEIGLETARKYDAVQDLPWALMYRELDTAFPGSKFILTLRDEDRWYRSIADHFGAKPDVLQELAYGADAPAPVGHEARYREVYSAHNAAVLEYFKDRPDDLLVMTLEDGDGWEKLCPFLGVEFPDAPFVHTNSSSQRRSLAARIRKRLARMGFPISVMDE